MNDPHDGSAPALTVLSVPVRIRDGLFSLNDLHKAAGGERRHEPARFLRNDQTKALIAEIKQNPDLGFAPVKSIRGGPGGSSTYVCKELVYAYAMWISPKFHLAVIRAFDAMVKARGRAGAPAASPSSDKVVTRAINRRAASLAMGLQGSLRAQLAAQVREILAHEPGLSPEALAARVERLGPAVAVLAGQGWRRALVTADEDSARTLPVPADAYVLPAEDWPRAVAAGDYPAYLLPRLLTAVLTRLGVPELVDAVSGARRRGGGS